MNLIYPSIQERACTHAGESIDLDSHTVEEHREVDYNNIDRIIREIWATLKSLNDTLDYEIKTAHLISAYSGFSQNYETQYIINQKFNNLSNEIRINIPDLKHGNYFILSNSYYIPTFVLERLPIDKNNNKGRVFLTFNNKHTLALFYNKKTKKYHISTVKNKKVAIDHFASVVFADQPHRLEELKNRKIIKKISKYNGAIKEVARAFGFYNEGFFKTEMRFTEFMNKYYMLPYFKEMCKSIYGTDKFEDLIWEAIKLVTNDDIQINLADLRNRRLVMAEYLISPVIDLYYRMLNLLVDKSATTQMMLPSMNQAAVITTGFRGNLHSKQLYDISTPYAIPLMYKVSQKIQIIQDNIPKSWTQLDNTHYRVFDPISVSAQSMASVITATRLVKVNKYGLFHVKGSDMKHTYHFPDQ